MTRLLLLLLLGLDWWADPHQGRCAFSAAHSSQSALAPAPLGAERGRPLSPSPLPPVWFAALTPAQDSAAAAPVEPASCTPLLPSLVYTFMPLRR